MSHPPPFGQSRRIRFVALGYLAGAGSGFSYRILAGPLEGLRLLEFFTQRAQSGEDAAVSPTPQLSAAQAATDISIATDRPVLPAPAIDEDPAPSPQKPTIGLVLGGGAARGFAHIGVLRTLLANGVKPDIIAGTSIGSVAGGCYAAGHLDGFEEWARSLTRRGVFRYLDFSLSGSGLIGGARLADKLRSTLGKMTFEELKIRFAAIATEIGTGHEIWLTRGRLVDALHASYALPGVFSPVRLGGRWLMDGALVNPVPVSAARALGARVVIAVNLNADLVGKGSTIASHGSDPDDEALHEASLQPRGLREMFRFDHAIKRQFVGAPGQPGFSTVMMEAFNIMQDRITRARLAGDPPDATITPRLGAVGLIDFHRAAESIALGAEAAEKSLDAITEAIAALR